MSIQYSEGQGKLYSRGIDKPIADVRYHLMTVPTNRYIAGKWWGTLSSNKDIRNTEDVILEFADGAKGDVFLYPSGKAQTNGRFPFTFNGRSRLKSYRIRGSSDQN
jgi:hypothetical protein